MSKRKLIKPKQELYAGTCGMEVLQLLLFYGYERMKDIVLLAKISKALYAWATGRVFIECTEQMFDKIARQEPTCSHIIGQVPTIALLQIQPKIRLVTLVFKPALEPHRLKFVSYSATPVNFIPLIMVTYDGEDGGFISRQTQSSPPSYIAATMEFEFDDDTRSHVSAVYIVARGHKQEITSL